MGLLLVTHDLLLASDICDGITVMYAWPGGRVRAGLENPIGARHPYSQGLLDAVPSWQPASALPEGFGQQVRRLVGRRLPSI